MISNLVPILLASLTMQTALAFEHHFVTRPPYQGKELYLRKFHGPKTGDPYVSKTFLWLQWTFIVIGAIFLLMIFAYLICCACRKRKEI